MHPGSLSFSSLWITVSCTLSRLKNLTTTHISLQFPISLPPLQQDLQKSCQYLSFPFPSLLVLSFPSNFWENFTQKLKKWNNEHPHTGSLDSRSVHGHFCTHICLHTNTHALLTESFKQSQSPALSSQSKPVSSLAEMNTINFLLVSSLHTKPATGNFHDTSP